jgi:hypothetical protein
MSAEGVPGIRVSPSKTCSSAVPAWSRRSSASSAAAPSASPFWWRAGGGDVLNITANTREKNYEEMRQEFKKRMESLNIA